MRAVHTYRGIGPAPDIEYDPWDVVFSPKRGYLVHTVRGNWEPLVIPADPSDRGPAGADGKPGRNGKDGRAGRDGIAGPVGPRGERGEKGDKGERGERGFRGYDGDTGMIIKKIGGDGATLGAGIFDSFAPMGALVYVSADGHVDLAIGTGLPQATAVGMAIEDVAAGAVGRYATSGPVTNPNWSLSAGSVYYLSTTVAGGMTPTFPNTIGDHVVILGAATDAQTISLKIDWALVIGS